MNADAGDPPPDPGAASERIHLFATGGSGVRLTGLRLRGPDPNRRDRYEYLNSDGLLVTHSSVEVDNCELWAWSHGAVYVKKGGDGAHVHHNDIHHNWFLMEEPRKAVVQKGGRRRMRTWRNQYGQDRTVKD